MPPFSPILVRSIWRGVRSGVLVLTETQVQNYSQSGKIGSKHPNVIFIYSLQCDFMQKNPKKHLKKKRRFFYENSAAELSNDGKYPQKPITKSRIAQYCL